MGLRVAIVGEVPAEEQQVVGGVQAATAYLIEGLARTGLELHIITLDYQAAHDSQRQALGVTYHRLAMPPRLGLVTAHAAARWRVNRLLATLAPDVVHGIGTGVHGYVALRAGYPAVLTVHGVQREDARYLSGLRNRLHGWLQGICIEAWCVAHARHVILIDPYVLQALPGLRQASLFPIPNPVAEFYFHLDPDPEPGRILYAGVIVPRKRLLDALVAVEQVRQTVPGVSLRVAGAATDPTYYAQVQRYAAEHGLAQRVAFLGPLSESALAEEYRRASVLLLPSAQETTPMVIAQAMAAATPVIATRVGGVPGMVEEGVTGLLTPPGDVAAIAGALKRLLTDPSQRRRMGERGRERARAHYAIERVAAETARVYQQARAACLSSPGRL